MKYLRISDSEGWKSEQLASCGLISNTLTLEVECQETQQFGLLRRFLRVNKVSSNLSQRITRFLQYTYHQREANSHDPYILDYLSKALKAETCNMMPHDVRVRTVETYKTETGIKETMNTLSTHCTLSEPIVWKAEMFASFRHMNCKQVFCWKPENRPEPPLSIWPLQAELQLARYSDCLAHLPFLDQLLTNDGMSVQEGHIMQTLAQRAVAILDSAEDDVVFCYGVSAVNYESSWPLERTSDNVESMKSWSHEKQWSAMLSHEHMILHDTPCAMLQCLRVGLRSSACSGCRADATYFILHGALCYLKKDDPTCRVRFGQWISEMCLWTEWLHLGDLISVSHSSARNVLSRKITWEKWSSICGNWKGRKQKSRQHTEGNTALTWGFAKLVAINVGEFCSIIGSAGGVQDRLFFLGGVGWVVNFDGRGFWCTHFLPRLCNAERLPGTSTRICC